MTEINNPKEFCNGSQSGTQQLQQDPCNCVPNIIAGPNIALTPNEDGSVTISATVTDTDTRLGNPHACAGAPAGYTRFCYDLINVISGATISADFTYVDVPNSTVQTLSVTGDQLSISGGNTITLPSDAVTGQATGHIIATHTAVNGTAFDIKETITTISGNDYINEAGASQAIVQSVSNAINATGGLTTTVNGVAGAVLDLCPAVKHCETDTTIDSIILNGTTLEIRYTGEDGVQQLQTVSLASLAIDINVTSLTYNPVTGEITLVETDGTPHIIDIGPFVETPITAVNTSSVNLTASGTSNHTLQADVKISATAGNTLGVNPDGLYVGPGNSACGIIGNGSVATPYEINPTIADTTTVPTLIEGKVDITTADIIPGVGDSGALVEAYTVYDPTTCKFKVYVPAAHTSGSTFNGLEDFTVRPFTAGSTILITSAPLSLTNPSTARSLDIQWTQPSFIHVFDNNGILDMNIIYEQSINGGAWTGVYNRIYRKQSVGIEYSEILLANLQFGFVVLPGATVTYQHRARIVVGANTSGVANANYSSMGNGIKYTTK